MYGPAFPYSQHPRASLKMPVPRRGRLNGALLLSWPSLVCVAPQLEQGVLGLARSERAAEEERLRRERVAEEDHKRLVKAAELVSLRLRPLRSL